MQKKVRRQDHNFVYSSDKDGEYDIWARHLNTDGFTGNPENLTSDHSGDCMRPRWSPAGSKIAFRSKNTGTDQIWIMDADGSNKTQLTFMDGYYCRWPSWSPAGNKIAFHRHLGTGTCSAYATTQICIMDSDGNNVNCYPNEGGHGEYSPSWSPDGTTIIYDRDERTCSNPKDLWMMNPDGTNKRAFYPPSGQNDDWWYQTESAWGKSGKIVFKEMVTTWNHWEIGVVNSDATNHYLIADPNGENIFPLCWAFGDQKIIYQKSSQLWMVDVDGTDMIQITDEPGNKSTADFLQ